MMSLFSRFFLTQNIYFHRRLASLIAAAVILLIPAASMASNQLTLGLASKKSSIIKGYRIYYKTGVTGKPYNGSGLSKGDSPMVILASNFADPSNAKISLTGLLPEKTYRFVATVYDINGNESKFSNEVVYKIPATLPVPLTYKINASASGNGTISPTGVTTVDSGETIAYKITPAQGHHISDVLVDGRSIGRVTTHTFSKVTSNHLIAVHFESNSGSSSSSNILFETGTKSINNHWTRVLFEKQYTNPVVVAGPLSYNGGDPSVVRIQNVNNTGFDIRVQEWPYLNEDHIMETVSYMVIEQGQYQLSDGTRLEAGRFQTNAADSHRPVPFGQNYLTAPVVMTSIATFNGSATVADRIRNITKAGFEYHLQEQEDSDHKHATETVFYLAWEPSSGTVEGFDYHVGKTGNAVTHKFYNIMFPESFDNTPVFLADMQTTNGDDTADIRYNDLDGFAVDVMVQEEQSLSEEMEHTTEVVGYMILLPAKDNDKDGLTNADEQIYGTNPNKADTDADGINDSKELAYWAERWNKDADNDGIINLLDFDSDNDGYGDGEEISAGTNPSVYNFNPQKPRLEVGQAQINNHWTRVSFEKQYTNPVVVAGPLSYNGGDPSVVRIQNVNNTGFDIRVQEWPYLNEDHITETVGYMVIEQGQYRLSDGTRFEAGRFQTNAADSHRPVLFEQDYSAIPVVMTSIATFNGPATVADRIRNITQAGFEYRLQEQEDSDHIHATETVSYLAWEPSSGVVDGLKYHIGRTGNAVTHKFYNIMFPESFDNAPVFLADMQTTNGDDTADIRYNDLDGFAVDVMVQEEQSLTEEMTHTTEIVGFMLFR